MAGEIVYQADLPSGSIREAAELYEIAFGEKLSQAIPNQADRLEFLAASLNPAYAFGALADGQLVGLAGYQTPDGHLTDGLGGAPSLQKWG